MTGAAPLTSSSSAVGPSSYTTTSKLTVGETSPSLSKTRIRKLSPTWSAAPVALSILWSKVLSVRMYTQFPAASNCKVPYSPITTPPPCTLTHTPSAPCTSILEMPSGELITNVPWVNSPSLPGLDPSAKAASSTTPGPATTPGCGPSLLGGPSK